MSTKKYTHAIHLYPARMHPEIARRLVAKYAARDGVVLDPFMGSGGVLLEAILHGNDAVGLDINPLAVLISRVKTTPLTGRRLGALGPALDGIVRGACSDAQAGGGGAAQRPRPRAVPRRVRP